MKSTKTLDNKGFTLIEVLLAVFVLAIVIVPLFHSFVSSHRINGKSKQYMRATTLAQDEMEIFEREKIADLIDPDKFDYLGEDGNPVQPDSDGVYTFIRENIDNNSGSNVSKFDVEVTLDPHRRVLDPTNPDIKDRYYDTNTKELFYMNTIASSDSAVHVQSIRSASNLKGYDDTIYEYFAANKSPTGGASSWGTDEFNKNLARRIKVKIYQENNGLNIATIVKVTYEYVLCQADVMPSTYQSYTEESIIFNNSAQSVGEDGKLPELKSVYLFYAPRYKGYTSPKSIDCTVDGEANTYKTDEEWIVIDNEAELPIDVYIVRQDIFKDGSNTEIEPVPVNYQPKIEIHDGIDGDGHTIGHYFTNLNIDQPVVSGENGLGAQIDFSPLKDNANTSKVYSSTEAKSTIDPKPLNGAGSAQAQEKDRIYTMTVKVYNHGADRTVVNPLVTMTGSKLE
ncbi:MAG: prepilin-type N-terminal cleavage/methylation domain-containing protein [Lachnospiraceae bacterium]|nr:prepilin-type N-terminal cleavage/methylation domain-containing protein [Lachnospiraceae bacterium]